MANIEVHGLKGARARDVRDQIFKILNWPDLVVTIVEDTTLDSTGNERPFLRVSEEAADPGIAARLYERLRINIEIVQVRKFIPPKYCR